MKLRALLALVSLGGANALAAIPPDVVFSADGEPVVGRVRDVETLFLVVKTEGAVEPVRIALDDLAWVDFGETRLMENFLRQSLSTPMPELRRFWRERLPLLGVPGSTGGAIGLRLGRRLLDEGSLEAAADVLEVADLIVQKDWNPETRAEAQLLRVQGLIALSRGLEAEAELQKLSATKLSAHLRSKAALIRGDLELQRGRSAMAYEKYLSPWVFGGAAPELSEAGLKRAREVAGTLPKSESRRSQIDEQLSGLRAMMEEAK